jgi:hypothetical protein
MKKPATKKEQKLLNALDKIWNGRIPGGRELVKKQDYFNCVVQLQAIAGDALREYKKAKSTGNKMAINLSLHR